MLFRYSALIMGVCNFAGNIPGIFTPSVIKALTPNVSGKTNLDTLTFEPCATMIVDEPNPNHALAYGTVRWVLWKILCARGVKEW